MQTFSWKAISLSSGLITFSRRMPGQNSKKSPDRQLPKLYKLTVHVIFRSKLVDESASFYVLRIGLSQLQRERVLFKYYVLNRAIAITVGYFRQRR
jgi:hypothetical protein